MKIAQALVILTKNQLNTATYDTALITQIAKLILQKDHALANATNVYMDLVADLGGQNENIS